MAPKLRVLVHNARLEERMQSQISTSLASVLKTNPKLTPKEAMWTVTNELLTNNPFQPPKDGKCPINDLPNEILGYIFSVGVKEDEEEWEDDEDAWEDASSDEEGDAKSDSSDDDSEDGSDIEFAAERLELSDGESSDGEDEVRIPFQVLVSHVCRRWREVALDSHVLWTSLDFAKRPNLEKAKVYISRAQGLPLNIFIDCTFPEHVDEEDHPDHPLYHDNEARKKAISEQCDDEECSGHDDDDHFYDEDVQFLSQKQLTQILDLIEPEVSHWRQLDFRASTYGYVHLFLSRLHALPSAPLLESFQVCHFEDCEDYEFFNGDDKTAFVPFHGNAPLLKEFVLWGVHIDWDAPFLTGLRELELSYHAKDVRPSYESFAKMISSSPELQSLTLSLSGPVLPEGVAFDADPEEAEGAWGPTPLTIPSLKDFAIQFQDPRCASALVQHLDMPALTSLLLNFDEEDYSSFVRTLIKPVKGRTESVLSHVENLKISGLPCDVATIELFLAQLTKLKTLNLKVVGVEEEVIFSKLVDPKLSRTSNTEDASPAPKPSQAASEDPSSGEPALPSVFLPQLESITTNQVSGAQLKKLVIARRDRGVPLKSVIISENDPITKKEEKWLRANVTEVEFFVPSDSEDDIDDDELDIIGIDEDDEDEEDEDSDENVEETPVGEHGEPLVSPLARHLRRGRGGRTGGGGLD